MRVLTVPAPRCRYAPISALDSPRAARTSASRSRGVSCSGPAPTAAPGPGRRANSAISRRDVLEQEARRAAARLLERLGEQLS
ncbi:hypothetical protein AMK19_06850 [Kitasatospora sp. CB01950]|nr:hypothetical protein AMK19_06850 [Kitasatospora sp. CB01950]